MNLFIDLYYYPLFFELHVSERVNYIFVIELLVAFLQAFIFTMLSSLFIGMAVVEHDHH